VVIDIGCAVAAIIAKQTLCWVAWTVMCGCGGY